MFGDLEGLKVAFVGDGNNVCNSHLNVAALTGSSLTVACPEGFDPDAATLESVRSARCTVVKQVGGAARCS